ncbi:MAG TPA: transglycosylase domain-containing protein, partial [Gammaproteobacteria bacterium]|nr:transglycosylase domain-containing protein [Gammaproteobacteria bacterium]
MHKIHLAKNFVALIFITIGIIAVALFYYIQFELPDTEALKNVQLQVPLQIYTNDGKLVATFGEKRRVPVPYDQIPKTLINAVLATEDQRYFQHPGVDFPGLIRAAIQLVITGR